MQNLLSTIYSLYPKGLEYGSTDYFMSTEHLNFKNILSTSRASEDEKLFYSTIKNIFDGYYVNNFTSDDYWSFEFIVLFNKIDNVLDDDVKLLNKLGGVRKDIFIYISKISKYYYYTFSITKLVEEKLHFEYEDLYHMAKNELCKFNTFMESQGFSLLDKKEIDQVIPDIETELTEKGQVKIFDLIFTDLYSHSPYGELN